MKSSLGYSGMMTLKLKSATSRRKLLHRHVPRPGGQLSDFKCAIGWSSRGCLYSSHLSPSRCSISLYSRTFSLLLQLSITFVPFYRFDGNMLGYLKTQMFDDTILAAMRGICVLTGLFGTVVAPWLEARLGSVRAGSWCIWCVLYERPLQIFLTSVSGPKWSVSYLWCYLSCSPLSPTLPQTQPCIRRCSLAVDNFIQLPTTFFLSLSKTGMAASRVGLWSFDLIQVKQLQETLADHPRRNALYLN